MRFANVGDIRQEAAPGLHALCPGCGQPVIAKCGQVKVWHWAHRGILNCDPWREPETEWHRAWKSRFPDDWQEVPLRAPEGELHRADVMTAAGQVIEFQHSRLHPSESAAREAFYKNLIWIVDGRARKRDMKQFFECHRSPMPVFQLPTFAIPIDACALLRDWKESRVGVYFDFGDMVDGQMPCLWRLQPGRRDGLAYITAIPREQFVQLLLKGDDFEQKWSHAVDTVLDVLKQRTSPRAPLPAFQQYLSGKQRAHARRRL